MTAARDCKNHWQRSSHLLMYINEVTDGRIAYTKERSAIKYSGWCHFSFSKAQGLWCEDEDTYTAPDGPTPINQHFHRSSPSSAHISPLTRASEPKRYQINYIIGRRRAKRSEEQTLNFAGLPLFQDCFDRRFPRAPPGVEGASRRPQRAQTYSRVLHQWSSQVVREQEALAAPNPKSGTDRMNK